MSALLSSAFSPQRFEHQRWRHGRYIGYSATSALIRRMRLALLHLTFATPRPLSMLTQKTASKVLRPQCRLSDARQTIGFFVGPCPTSAVRNTRRDRLNRVLSLIARMRAPQRPGRANSAVDAGIGASGACQCLGGANRWLRPPLARDEGNLRCPSRSKERSWP